METEYKNLGENQVSYMNCAESRIENGEHTSFPCVPNFICFVDKSINRSFIENAETYRKQNRTLQQCTIYQHLTITDQTRMLRTNKLDSKS